MVAHPALQTLKRHRPRRRVDLASRRCRCTSSRVCACGTCKLPDRGYERLFGQPSFFPNATEAVWTLADDRSVYVVEHADGAGNSVVTIFVDDLDAHVAAVAARGLESDERLTYSNGLRKALYCDPDGNELGFGGAPLDTGS